MAARRETILGARPTIWAGVGAAFAAAALLVVTVFAGPALRDPGAPAGARDAARAALLAKERPRLLAARPRRTEAVARLFAGRAASGPVAPRNAPAVTAAESGPPVPLRAGPVWPPVTDSPLARDLHVAEADASRAAIALGVVSREEIESELARHRRTPGESEALFEERLEEAERRLLSDRLLVEWQIRQQYASRVFPNGYPVDYLPSSFRTYPDGLPPERRAEALREAAESIGELPSQPRFAEDPEVVWRKPPPEGTDALGEG